MGASRKSASAKPGKAKSAKADRSPSDERVRLRTRLRELERALEDRAGLEAALQQAELRFRSLVENMPDTVFCHGTEGDGPHGYDGDGLRVFGKHAPALVGTLTGGKANLDLWHACLHPDDRAAYLEAQRRRRERGTGFTMEYRFFHPETGELRWVQECAWVVEDAGAGRRYLDSYIFDVTDRRRTEDALVESEQRFRDFAEAASDWFWEMDEDLRFTYLSDRILEASGIAPESHYGKTRPELGNPGEDPDKWSEHQATLEARKPFRDFTFRRVGPDGRTHHIRTSGVPVFDERGGFKGYRGVGSEITAEVRAHEALKESEARLKAIIDNSPLVIALKDVHGRCVLANRRYSYMFGAPEEGSTGLTVFDLFDREHADKYWRHERRVLESGHAIEEEMVNRTVEGERILLENKFPIRNEAGEIVGLGFIGTDITDRKRADERFRQYFNLPLVGAVISSPDKRLIEVNDKMCEILGYAREELLRMTWLDITHADDVEASNVVFDRIGRQEQDDYSLQKRYVRKDGRIIHVIVSTNVTRRADGAPDYFMTLIEDVTERKQAEEALRRSEQRFRDFAEISSDWFWETDENHRFTYFSERLFEVTGLGPAALVGKTALEVGRGTLAEAKWRRHLADLEARRPFRDFRYAHAGASDRAQQWSISGVPVFDEDGKFKGYRGTGTDVTAQEQAFAAQRTAMEEAEAASRAKSTFLANMSHELRTPLNAIIGFSEIMRDELLGPIGVSHYQQYAKDIHDSGSHLLSLINDILDLSKIEAGKHELEEEDVDIAAAVEASLRIIEPRAKECGLTVAVELSPALPVVRADLRALKQILLNLLSNAVKFTEAGGQVGIAGRVDGDGSISLSVSDTGIGMSDRDLEIALTAFGQVDSPYTRQHQGTGLGLPLVRALAELHGGSLELKSELGSGTTAVVRLPAERALPRPAKNTSG